ncbi:MAG: aminoacyl-tRNA hydrolase [Victivallaceae bacterium]|nr:aminoacyl-tRNA hydrolase [Victivallaceae bacterium]
MNETESIRLIVGLGNPGAEYANTRHNAGFDVIDRLLAGFPAGRFAAKHTAESMLYDGSFRGKRLLIQKPLTFMNSSGDAVGVIARRENIAPEEILIVSDDLDLPVGRLRLRIGGADGGHNGLKSVMAALGSGAFRRLRVGIGRPRPGETVDYVLSRCEGDDAKRFAAVLDAAAEAAKTVLAAGMSRAMNKFNAWVPPEEEELKKEEQP